MKEAKVKDVLKDELFYHPGLKAFYRRLKDGDNGTIRAEPANRQGDVLNFHASETVVV